jgi:cytochrome c2
MPRTHLTSSLFLLLAALAGCSGGEEQATPPPTPPPATTEAPPPTTTTPPPPATTEPAAEADPNSTRDLMQNHFGRAASAHDAIVRADLEQARADMQWLATHEEGMAVPEPLRPMLVEMQAEAARFAEATTLTEAATSYARTLVRCGACHTASHGGPEMAEPIMPEGDTPEARMRRHQWASDRMFDGLVTGNAEIFRSGNDALTSAPLTQADLPATATQPTEQVVALTTHVQNLGSEAAAATTDEARASIYGRYLATCATCHRLLEGGTPEGLQPVGDPE